MGVDSESHTIQHEMQLVGMWVGVRGTSTDGDADIGSHGLD